MAYNIEKEGKLLYSFQKASITLMPKFNTDYTREKNTSLNYINAKILNKMVVIKYVKAITF